MDEDISIINSNTRNERIKSFFLTNKKVFITILSIFILAIIAYFFFDEIKQKNKLKNSDKYNSLITGYSEKNKELTKNGLIDLINENDTTYSPLSLYFIIDNNMVTDKKEINELFNLIIEDTPLSKEVKNLLIYKKALYNADDIAENELLEILKPIISTNSVWKSHALYLMGEYFYSKNEKQKSKEFFNQVIILENASQDLIVESQKRLNRDLSE